MIEARAPLLIFEEIDSTNEEARRRAQEEAIATERQLVCRSFGAGLARDIDGIDDAAQGIPFAQGFEHGWILGGAALPEGNSDDRDHQQNTHTGDCHRAADQEIGRAHV